MLFSLPGDIIIHPPEEQNVFPLGVGKTEIYSEQKHFVGTVIEEIASHRIAAPSEDEAERKIADRIEN